jgi:hypothetical protein
MKHDDTGAYYEEDEQHQIHETTQLVKSPLTSSKLKTTIICAILFTVAFAIRLYYLFFIANPDNPGAGWFGDSYHHWQIGYLTKEIGLSQGFLRVWDLKGMDLFWGLLHPLVLAFLFKITGDQSMGLARSVTCFSGAISVVLIYLLGKKYWNSYVGLAAALFTACCSVIIFNDATGMIEPLGIPFLLGGIYCWPKRPFIGGILLGVAMLTRSEFWIFSLGLTAAFIIWDRIIHMDKKVLLILGVLAVLVPYMKYLLDYTSNPIYPFYQNFRTNIKGDWQFKKVLDPADLQGQFIFRVILVITLLAIAITLWRRPRGWQLFLFGLGNWLFLALTFGVSAYIKSWADYVWVVRFMLFPYTFLGIFISVVLFAYMSDHLSGVVKGIYLTIAAIFMTVIIGLTQFAWIEIYKYYVPTNKTWESVKEITTKVIKPYQGGKILMPEGNPDITYALVQYHQIEGKNMVSQMYDPYFYYEEQQVDPYANWQGKNPKNKDGLTYREEVLSFFKKNNIKYIITYANRDRYLKLFELEKDIFTKTEDGTISNFATYYVNTENI